MTTNFKSLIELLQFFSNEQISRDYLAAQRWGDTPCCPYCGHDKVYKIEQGKRYKCASKECYSKFSVTVGTIFEDSKLPLVKWFAAIYLCTAHKKGISSHQLARDLNISQKSAWFVLHRVREMLREKAPVMLRNEVEIDETYVGGKERNKHLSKRTEGSHGRSLKGKTPVLGILERDGKVFTQVVPDTKARTIVPMVASVVADATIYTDEYRCYHGLGKLYTHKLVRHNLGIYVDGDIHTNTIEGFWSLLKRGIIGIYHQTSAQHLHRYCDEFAYRYNTRGVKDTERFSASFQGINSRLTYKALTK